MELHHICETSQIGGSSENPMLPSNAESAWECIRCLNLDFSNISNNEVLEALSHVKPAEHNFTCEEISIILSENCTYPVPESLCGSISRWIFCFWNKCVGRKAARDEVVGYYQNQHHQDIVRKAARHEVVGYRENQYHQDKGTAIVKSDHGDNHTHSDNKGEVDHASELDPNCSQNLFNEERINKSAQRASQILKSSQLVPFDGTTNVNRYWLFKYEVQELISSSGAEENSLTSFELLLVHNYHDHEQCCPSDLSMTNT
jgi:hypothetical protein